MAAFHYEYPIKGLQKVSAQVAGEVCEQLSNSVEGLTPSSLLDASRDVNAPLHCEFEWSDDIAAEKYRTEQARNIIRNIRIIRAPIEVDEIDAKIIQAPIKTEVIADRAFVSVEKGTNEYVPINEALQDDVMRQELLRQAKTDCDQFLAKYERLQELCGVREEMKKFMIAV